MDVFQKLSHMQFSFRVKERSSLWERRGMKYLERQLYLPSRFNLPILESQYLQERIHLELPMILLKNNPCVIFFFSSIAQCIICVILFVILILFFLSEEEKPPAFFFFFFQFIVSRLKLNIQKLVQLVFVIIRNKIMT